MISILNFREHRITFWLFVFFLLEVSGSFLMHFQLTHQVGEICDCSLKWSCSRASILLTSQFRALNKKTSMISNAPLVFFRGCSVWENFCFVEIKFIWGCLFWLKQSQHTTHQNMESGSLPGMITWNGEYLRKNSSDKRCGFWLWKLEKKKEKKTGLGPKWGKIIETSKKKKKKTSYWWLAHPFKTRKASVYTDIFTINAWQTTS